MRISCSEHARRLACSSTSQTPPMPRPISTRARPSPSWSARARSEASPSPRRFSPAIWGRYIPGNPTVILRQMPGGAHLNATNHVFNVAEPDGLTILAANPQVAMAQLFKMPAVRFDVRQFTWIGSSGADAALLAIRPDLPYKTFKDLTNAKEELIFGTTGPGSNAHDVPLLLKEFAGAKFKLVSGYAANTDIKLALERKEVDGWTALATTVRLAGEQGIVRPMVRSSRAPMPGLDHIPVDEDLATSDLGRALMVIRGTPLGIGRPFRVRPGTPADRVAMLREVAGQGAGRSEIPGRDQDRADRDQSHLARKWPSASTP